MRKIIMAGLMAASLVPVAAQAQWVNRDYRDHRDEYRDDRRDYREEYRDQRQGWGRDRDRQNYGHSNWNRGNWDRGNGYNNLPRAGWGQRWVRHHRDFVLVERDGDVLRVIRNYYR